MVVFVPCGPVTIGFKPFTYGRHCGRKLTGAYADRDAIHGLPHQAFPHVNTPLLQTKDVKSLTIFAQFYLAISCLQQAAIEISQSVLDGGKRPAIVSVKWGDRVAERANFVAIF